MSDVQRPPSAVFIDENLKVLEGQIAEARLREVAARDDAVLDAARGIVRVDPERWREAQRYERRTWLGNPSAQSDRNEYHRTYFAGYEALAGRSFKRAIELGCGPFTNMRYILERADIESVHLLDPLINDYIAGHPFCRYRHGRLGGVLKDWPSPRALRHPADYVRNVSNAWRIGGLRGRSVTTHAVAIEAFEVRERFDLVVMINVIEHCSDADVVFKKIIDMLEPGGVLVFADRLFEAEHIRQMARVIYDAGHPLRLDASVTESFLSTNFKCVFRSERVTPREFHGIRWEDTELYFVGSARSGTTE